MESTVIFSSVSLKDPERTRRGRIFAILAWAGVALAGCDSTPPAPGTPSSAISPPPSSDPVAATASAGATADVVPPPLPKGPAGERVALQGGVMGTTLTLATFTTDALDEAAIKPKLEKALAEIQRLEGLMTTWREDSELSRVNQNAGDKAMPVGPETLAVILKSQWISAQSSGVFDISFDAMHGLWKFDEDRTDNIPPKAEIEKRRKLIDYRQIEVDEAASTVFLKKKGMRINLGGIAKGYAVDAASEVLRREGLTSFFVQAGGDLYVAGTKPGGAPYRVGVRDPRGAHENDFFAMVEVQDHAFSTAGDYERSFVKDGKRYHHIIDPRTGYPATASRSVTVWAKSALVADAVDDAVFILGVKKGMALVESIEDCGAVVVDAENKVHVSRRLEGKVKVLREPTGGI